MAGAPTDGSAARCCLRDACAASISYRSQGRGIGTRPITNLLDRAGARSDRHPQVLAVNSGELSEVS